MQGIYSSRRLECAPFVVYASPMNQEYLPPADPLASIVAPETQRLAARMSQDIFTGILHRLASPGADDERSLDDIARRCQQWVQAGGDECARSLRLVLLVAGLDQWGLAYSQAFGLNAIPALSGLLGKLRNPLDPVADSRFQRYHAQLEQDEATAIDFKIDLRRGIHLALWHAMSACDDDAAAEPLVRTLGSLLLALEKQMPELGWRLVADALASLQVALLAGDVGEIGQRGTQQLFSALRHALPAERYRLILATSAQAVLAWQQARRQGE